MSEQDGYPGFAPEHDAPIPYMQRIREYYQALGYGAPYRWAHYAEVPFQPLKSRWRMPRRPDHDGGSLSARQRRPGTWRGLQCRRQIL